MKLAFLPEPHKIRLAPKPFRIPASGEIGICCQELYPAAQRARELFAGYAIHASAPGVKDTVRLALVEGLARDGYKLTVSPAGVAIVGDSPAAIEYALATLQQAAAQSPRGTLPAMEIEDRPDFQDRGVYYDVCRGRVPKLESIFQQVDLLARHKINHYQLYIEHTFHFRGHGDIGKGASPLEAEDILKLDAYCRQRHVELVPSLASFGHLSTVLHLPQYRHLAEDWGIGKYVAPDMDKNWKLVGWSLSPANPKVYEWLDSLFAEFLPLFTSDRFNVCCDETWDLGAGQTYELCQKLGKGRVYLNHIIKLSEIAARYGKRIMFWGDIIRKYPELINDIPKNVTVLDWGYGYNHPFDALADFKKAGLEFYACPGTSSWVSLFPRLHEATANIAGFAAAGKANGARGLLNTDWGDGGHYNFMEFSWHGYLFGAEQAWNVDADPSTFTSRFCKLFLGDGSGKLAKAVDELGDIAHIQFSRYYQSIWQHLLFASPDDELFRIGFEWGHLRTGGKIGRVQYTLDAKFARKIVQRLAAVRQIIAQTAKAPVADPHGVLEYWLFAIDTMAVAARKLAAFGLGGQDTPAIRKAIKKDQAALQKRFAKLWRARNRESEIRQTLDRYAKAIASL